MLGGDAGGRGSGRGRSARLSSETSPADAGRGGVCCVCGDEVVDEVLGEGVVAAGVRTVRASVSLER